MRADEANEAMREQAIEIAEGSRRKGASDDNMQV